MTNYPYYIAVRYSAGQLIKYQFGVANGKKFKTFSDCANAIRKMYERIPQTKEEQILILEYTNQYESKIIDVCMGDDWRSIGAPVKLDD